MKKTLLAAALIAGYAGAASAQNSVTLYGVIDLGLQYQSIGAPNGSDSQGRSRFGMQSGQQSGSRWGIRGVEDLGDGLKATFRYESGINATSGSSGGFDRWSTLGLESTKWGGLQLGRADSPVNLAFSGVDPFGASFSTSSVGTTNGQLATNRYSNMIQYATPNLAGFVGRIAYSFDTGGTVNNTAYKPGYSTGNKPRAFSLGLRYGNGPVLLAAGWDNINAPGNITSPDSIAGTTIKAWTVGGTYDFKVVKVHATYGQNIDGIVNGVAIADVTTSGGDQNVQNNLVFSQGARTNQWMFGLSAPVGAGSAFASFQQRTVGGTLNQTVDGLSSATMSVASIGYSYPFSKRTNAYAFYSYGNNYANLSGSSTNTLGVGIRHLF